MQRIIYRDKAYTFQSALNEHFKDGWYAVSEITIGEEDGKPFYMIIVEKEERRGFGITPNKAQSDSGDECIRVSTVLRQEREFGYGVPTYYARANGPFTNLQHDDEF